MTERGNYIVLEGGDGTGKSTQAILLDAYVRSLGYDTLRVFNDETGQLEPVQEPGGTPEANKIRRRIKDAHIPRTPWQNVEWFTEARELIWYDAILPALEQGRHVITARNWFSTLAYQGYGEGIPIDEIEQYTREHIGQEYMTPDFVAILALKHEALRRQRLMARRTTDHECDTFESMPDEFQTSMQDGYLQLAQDRGIKLIDATGTRTQVFRRVLKQVESLIDTA